MARKPHIHYPDVFYHVIQIQLCLVHMIRHSLRYVTWKQCKEVAADLRLLSIRLRLSKKQNLTLGSSKTNGTSAIRQSANHGGGLGTDHSFILISPGNLQGDIYDQCYRIGENVTALGDKESVLFPQ